MAERNNNTTRLNQVDGGIGYAGIGCIVVPDIQRRGEYIQDCYRTHTVTIHGGWGYGFIPSVRIPLSVLQEINFPPGGNYNRGTQVVWVKDPISQRPVIVAALPEDGVYYELEERTWRVTRVDGETVIDLFADAKHAKFQLNILGRDDAPATLDIKVSSLNSGSNASAINVSCDNKINITAGKEVSVLTEGAVDVQITKDGKPKGMFHYDHADGLQATVENRAQFTVRDEEDNVMMHAQYLAKDIEEQEETEDQPAQEAVPAGFTYKDQWGNEINTREKVIEIISSKLVQINKGENRGIVNIAQIESLVKALAKDLAIAQSGSNLSQWMAEEMPKMEDKNATH